MTLDEFKKQVYHTEKSIVIPSLGRIRINKIQFFKNNIYQPSLLDDYLEELYHNKYK